MKTIFKSSIHKLSNLIRTTSFAVLLIFSLTTNMSWATPPTGVNINTASAEVIAETLSGIGLKRAQAIVAWRENHGAFTHKEQITAIKGIGESTLTKNDALIRLK